MFWSLFKFWQQWQIQLNKKATSCYFYQTVPSRSPQNGSHRADAVSNRPHAGERRPWHESSDDGPWDDDLRQPELSSEPDHEERSLLVRVPPFADIEQELKEVPFLLPLPALYCSFRWDCSAKPAWSRAPKSFSYFALYYVIESKTFLYLDSKLGNPNQVNL